MNTWGRGDISFPVPKEIFVDDLYRSSNVNEDDRDDDEVDSKWTLFTGSRKWKELSIVLCAA